MDISGLELHPLPHGASILAANQNVPHLDVALLDVVDAPHLLDEVPEAAIIPHARIAVVTTIAETVVIAIALAVQMTGTKLSKVAYKLALTTLQRS